MNKTTIYTIIWILVVFAGAFINTYVEPDWKYLLGFAFGTISFILFRLKQKTKN